MMPDEDDPAVHVPEWRKVKIRFDIEENTCDVQVGGQMLIADLHLGGIRIPSSVYIGVCGATTAESHVRWH